MQGTITNMDIKHNIINEPSRYNNIVWGVIVISSVLLIITVDLLMSAFSSERFILSREAENLALSNKFTKSVEFLSKQARMFIVTREQSDLDLYVDEITNKKSRENTLKKLKKIQASQTEYDKLSEAKTISDKLIDIEKQSMLLARGTNINSDKLNIKLSKEHTGLAGNEKINKARELLFSKDYENLKNKISIKVLEYQKLMTQRTTQDAAKASDYTSIVMLSVIILSTIIILAVITLIWLKILAKKPD